MLAYDGPRNARVAVGVATVKFIPVIEPNRTLVSGSNRRTPLQDLLGPVHPHVVVHPARQDHLFLSSVPQGIVSFSLLWLFSISSLLIFLFSLFSIALLPGALLTIENNYLRNTTRIKILQLM